MLSLLSTAILGVMMLISLYKAYTRKEMKKFIVYVMVLLIAVYSLKFLLAIERPSTQNILFSFDKYSFPSTHATLSMGLGAFLSTPLSIIAALLVSIIRVIIEAHHTTDIIGGWILAIILYAVFYHHTKIKNLKKLLLRKALHIIFMLPLFGSSLLFPHVFMWVALAMTLGYVMLLFSPLGKRIYKKVRYRERQKDYLSPLYIILGSLIVYMLYPIEYLVVALIYLSFADAFSTIIGKTFPIGKMKNGRHLSGSIFGTFIGYTITSFTYPPLAMVSAISYVLLEISLPKKINDNAVIPLWISTITFVALGVI